MKIAIGADHGGFELKEALIPHLRQTGHEVLDLGTSSREAVDYPDYARAVAEAVASGRIERGIVIDGAGIGSAMVANKVPGVRAALAYDLSSARNGREHNDANVLTLGAGLIGASLARQLVDVFLSTDCVEERHLRRVEKISIGERTHATGSGDSSGTMLPRTASSTREQISAAELSDQDLARIIDRLEGLLGNGRNLAATAGPSVAAKPATARRLLALGVERLSHGPDAAGTIPEDIAAYIDHTLLKPGATRAQILRVCDEAREYAFKAVCVNPCWVATVAQALRGSSVLTCSVVGFPLGASTPAIKAFETRRAIRDGAREIDTVINVGALKSGDEALVLKDLRAVTEACRDGSARSKVIIETVLLDEAEKVRACELARLARADFVKTSTGFAGGGATIEDVVLMARVVGSAGMEVKASGGIKNFDDALNMIGAGATRIGASAGVAIVQEAHGRDQSSVLHQA